MNCAGIKQLLSKFHSEHPLSDQRHYRSEPKATTARQAAEALFSPRPQALSPVPEGEPPRKPRILPALRPVQRDEARESPSPAQQTLQSISRSTVARIRTWLRYGMTLNQAAKACGVSTAEIKRALSSDALMHRVASKAKDILPTGREDLREQLVVHDETISDAREQRLCRPTAKAARSRVALAYHRIRT